MAGVAFDALDCKSAPSFANLRRIHVRNLRVVAKFSHNSRNHRPYLDGQEDLVSRLITPTTHIVTLIIPIINLLAKSPDPPSKPQNGKGICQVQVRRGSESQRFVLKGLSYGWDVEFNPPWTTGSATTTLGEVF